MTIKKLTVIAAAGAVLLAGALGISMSLTSRPEMELEVSETPVAEETESENGSRTLADMENIPLYFDNTEKLLLPLRNVMEGLGGSVVWNPETRMTEVSYRGRTLALNAGEKQATLNGYEVTLPEAAEIINGCLYADEVLISAYFTDEVNFNAESRQVTLQTKESSVPVVALKEINGKAEDKEYAIQVPVVVGLNDSHYEKSLNAAIAQEMQNLEEDFLAEQKEGKSVLQLDVKSGMCTEGFVSLLWEGSKDGMPMKLAKNYDLLGQKTVTLADMVKKTSLEAVRVAGGDGWTADRFYLTAEGGLVLLKGSNESSQNLYYWTTEGEQPAWKDTYQGLFRKNNE